MFFNWKITPEMEARHRGDESYRRELSERPDSQQPKLADWASEPRQWVD
jgi:hypothetical protein